MAMNFNQMLKFQQIKNTFKRFDQDHPKFKNFMNAVWREQALKQDAVIEISITSPEGKNYCSNIKLNAADIEMFEQLKSMKPEYFQIFMSNKIHGIKKSKNIMLKPKKKASQISRLTFLIFTVILPQTPDFSCF